MTTMTEAEFAEAARRGLDLPAALDDGFLGLRISGGGLAGLSRDWCVEYRPPQQIGTGLGCRSVAVYVDGMRITDPGSFFASQPIEDIVRAEVLSAVDAVTRYGNSAGYGVLLIETRTGQLGLPSANVRNVTGLDWSPLETKSYPWAKVLGSTFLANAAGFGISQLLTNRCFVVDNGYDGPYRCNLPSSAGTIVVGVVLPNLAGSFAARWAGTTDRSQGRFTPSAILGSLTGVAGYALFVDKGMSDSSAGGKVVGALLITVATPLVTVLSDRIFRVLR